MIKPEVVRRVIFKIGKGKLESMDGLQDILGNRQIIVEIIREFLSQRVELGIIKN